MKSKYETLEVVPGCPLCGNPERKNVYADPRYTEKQNKYIVQCQGCGMCYVSPLILQKYDNIPVDAYPWEMTNIPGFLYMLSVFDSMLQKTSPMIMQKTNKRFLELGCGPGFVLDIMRSRFWETTGLEPWKSLAEWASKYLRLDVRAQTIETAGLPRNHYDAVFMAEVLEHLPNPVEVLKMTYDHLTPGGVVFISCPNFDSQTFKEQGWEWPAIEPYGHIQYFTPKSLLEAMTKAGFRNVIIHSDGGLPHRDEQLMAMGLRAA